METLVASTLVIRKRPAPNSNSEKQFRFHSTKKKRCKGSRWAKPTIEEQNIVREKMENTKVEVCGICMKQDDNVEFFGDYVAALKKELMEVNYHWLKDQYLYLATAVKSNQVKTQQCNTSLPLFSPKMNPPNQDESSASTCFN